MFKFNGSLPQLRAYISRTFTKSAQKRLDLFIRAHAGTVQVRGTLPDVSKMLGMVFRPSHLKTLLLDVEIHDAPTSLLDTIHDLARTPGKKIPAIKAYREFAGCDLVTAKNYVEDYIDRAGMKSP